MYWAFWSCVSSKFLTVWNCQQRRQTEQTKPLTGFQNISKCFCTKITSFYYFCHIVPWRGWQGWPDLWSFYQFRWPPTSAPLGHRHFGLIGSRLINQPCQPPLATASAFFCLILHSEVDNAPRLSIRAGWFGVGSQKVTAFGKLWAVTVIWPLGYMDIPWLNPLYCRLLNICVEPQIRALLT